MLKIESNGSKWHGDAPDSIDQLLAVLASEPLDPSFEEYGNFVTKNLRGCVYLGRGRYRDTDLIYPEAPNTQRFWGNFANLSHVFCIDTDEPETIAALTTAIRANQKREDYQRIKRELCNQRKAA